LKKKNIKLPAGLVLVSPWLDFHENIYNGEDPFLLNEWMNFFVEITKKGRAGEDSVLNFNYTGYPPVFIDSAKTDPLHPPSTIIARKIEQAGVRVKKVEYDHLFHDSQIFWGFIPEGQQAVNNVGNFVKDILHTK